MTDTAQAILEAPGASAPYDPAPDIEVVRDLAATERAVRTALYRLIWHAGWERDRCEAILLARYEARHG